MGTERGTERETADKLNVALLAQKMREGVEVKDQTYFFSTYEQCFVGEQAVAWLLSFRSSGATTVEEALSLGDKMLAEGLIYHVPTMFQPLATDLSYLASNFQNGSEFYRFAVNTAGSKTLLARRSSDEDLTRTDSMSNSAKDASGRESLVRKVAHAQQVLEATWSVAMSLAGLLLLLAICLVLFGIASFRTKAAVTVGLALVAPVLIFLRKWSNVAHKPRPNADRSEDKTILSEDAHSRHKTKESGPNATLHPPPGGHRVVLRANKECVENGTMKLESKR